MAIEPHSAFILSNPQPKQKRPLWPANRADQSWTIVASFSSGWLFLVFREILWKHQEVYAAVLSRCRRRKRRVNGSHICWPVLLRALDTPLIFWTPGVAIATPGVPAPQIGTQWILKSNEPCGRVPHRPPVVVPVLPVSRASPVRSHPLNGAATERTPSSAEQSEPEAASKSSANPEARDANAASSP